MENNAALNYTISELEEAVRLRLQRTILFLVLMTLGLEIGMGIYLYASGSMRQSPLEYTLLRILLPFAINLVLYFSMKFSNISDKFSIRIKNRICSTALIIYCGEMGIIHSYFIPMWSVSLFGLMVAAIFHDSVYHKIQSAFCLVFIFLSGLTHIYDYPEDFGFTVQCLVVTEVVAVAICMLAFMLEEFSGKEFVINIEATRGAQKYKTWYEFDFLTGVFSRAHLEEAAHKIFEQRGADSRVAVAMMDIDDFKKINDVYGHDNGDKVLRKLGEYLVVFNTSKTVCGRYGGEEFVIVFEECDGSENIDELEGLRGRVEQTTYEFKEGPVTLSIGYYEASADDSFETALKKADDALYKSKSDGKNRVTVG